MSIFNITFVLLNSIKEFVFIWSNEIALFLDILVGLVTAGIKTDEIKDLNIC